MNTKYISPKEYAQQIASNLRSLRNGRKISLRKLSKMSNVSYASLRRFEETGEISLKSLLKVVVVLDCEEQIINLFKNDGPISIEELIERNNGK